MIFAMCFFFFFGGENFWIGDEKTQGKAKGSVINSYGSCMDGLFHFFLIWKKHGRREGFVIMDLVWIFSGVFWWKEIVATAMSTSDICMRILVMIGQESDIRSDTDKDYENVIVIIVDNANGTPTAPTQMFFPARSYIATVKA